MTMSFHFFAVESSTGSGNLRSTDCSVLSGREGGGALAERVARVRVGREEKHGDVGLEPASTMSASEPSSGLELVASAINSSFWFCIESRISSMVAMARWPPKRADTPQDHRSTGTAKGDENVSRCRGAKGERQAPCEGPAG